MPLFRFAPIANPMPLLIPLKSLINQGDSFGQKKEVKTQNLRFHLPKRSANDSALVIRPNHLRIIQIVRLYGVAAKTVRTS